MNVFSQHMTDNYAAYNVDTVEFTAGMPDNSIDFSVYSPPFSSLYIYSDSERDMGNVAGDEEFQAAYRHLVREMLRVTKPGRLSAIHVKDLVYYSNASDKGDRGLRDFTGDCIRTHVEEGWSFHSRVTIWRCPVKEMQKSKPDGLLFKNFRTDCGRNRQGMPEYLVVFRKWAEGMDEGVPITHDPAEFPLDIWREWASPVWTTTRETDVLNAKLGGKTDAEKHICPMPLDITDRAVRLWSNPGDTIYSPFMGIGSEGYASLRAARKFIGTELKPEYYQTALRHLDEAEKLGSATGLGF